MKEVIHLDTYRMQKQYQNAGSLSINLALDEKKQGKLTRNISKELTLGYMKLLSK